MAITKVCPMRTGWQGTVASDGGDGCTLMFEVHSDNQNDGWSNIVDHFLLDVDLPYLLDPYNFRAGADQRSSYFCNSITPRRVSESAPDRNLWNVTCTFAPLYEQRVEMAEDDTPTLNPLNFARAIETDFIERPVDRHQGTFLGCHGGWPPPVQPGDPKGLPYDGGAGGFTRPIQNDDIKHGIVNSRGKQYDEPREGRESELALRIRIYSAAFDASWKGYLNKLNDKPLNLVSAYHNLNLAFAEDEILCAGLQPRFVFINNVKCWELWVELHTKEGGWHDFILDEGMSAYAGQDANDGKGGSYPDNPPAGVPRDRRMKDREGEVLPEKVLLNGSGQPEVQDNQYFHEYRVPYQAALENLPIGLEA